MILRLPKEGETWIYDPLFPKKIKFTNYNENYLEYHLPDVLNSVGSVPLKKIASLLKDWWRPT